ncbi:MAG: ribonuclease HII [Desulfobacterales bacterium]
MFAVTWALPIHQQDLCSVNLWAYEKQAISAGYCRIAGIDEAGRGPLAGPVVSAAVILPSTFSVPDVTDSKKLAPQKREYLYGRIYEQAVAVGIGIVDSNEIDRINILNASLLSMVMAVGNLFPMPDFLLIDGNFPIRSAIPQETVVRGDSLSISVACASIVAKVTRDRLMERYHEDDPRYGFDQHKGYATREHREAIRKYGYCFIHRKTFKGVDMPLQLQLFGET